MKKVGFIGLGIMGHPMANHLLDAGFEVTVYNRSAQKAKQLVEKGAELADSPADLARNSEVVITMLANSDVISNMVFGENGILKGYNKGLIFINCSTVSPKSNIELYLELKKNGIEMLDAPVTGSGVQANLGTLTFMCGGSKDIYEKCVPLFNAMGKQSFYMGEIGAGSYTKLANNTMLAINMMSLAEAIVMVTKCGIDPETFVSVVSGGGSKSAMAEAKTPKIVTRDFSPNFKSSLMLKDVGLALDLAKELELPVPVLSVSKDLLQIAKTKGYGDEDLCSIVKCYEEWGKIEVSKRI